MRPTRTSVLGQAGLAWPVWLGLLVPSIASAGVLHHVMVATSEVLIAGALLAALVLVIVSSRSSWRRRFGLEVEEQHSTQNRQADPPPTCSAPQVRAAIASAMSEMTTSLSSMKGQVGTVEARLGVIEDKVITLDRTVSSQVRELQGVRGELSSTRHYEAELGAEQDRRRAAEREARAVTEALHVDLGAGPPECAPLLRCLALVARRLESRDWRKDAGLVACDETYALRLLGSAGVQGWVAGEIERWRAADAGRLTPRIWLESQLHMGAHPGLLDVLRAEALIDGYERWQISPESLELVRGCGAAVRDLALDLGLELLPLHLPARYDEATMEGVEGMLTFEVGPSVRDAVRALAGEGGIVAADVVHWGWTGPDRGHLERLKVRRELRRNLDH